MSSTKASAEAKPVEINPDDDSIEVTPNVTLHVGRDLLLMGEPVLVSASLAEDLARDRLIDEADEILGTKPAQPLRRVIGGRGGTQ